MANSILPRRIIKETQRLLSEPAPVISASPSGENMRYFNVMIFGPEQSPYEASLTQSNGIAVMTSKGILQHTVQWENTAAAAAVLTLLGNSGIRFVLPGGHLPLGLQSWGGT
ncbi:uncharacterized protein LOC100832365 isoform X4 [Brachypodium distachyon]|uniref:uncharacterized protein LOC100832365 isoform X4 n=1 Tax=Brachypodium distachyon TaxID=15368 RepID=UPI000D0DC538|nr:uncharacterized protein LOC100832365 isoform X4 [Brachypodium distachyon]|eukprot:XP_024310543.1 uncharacterized protein LOC100832365 isoform X4 [Brachypodium distachyon]